MSARGFILVILAAVMTAAANMLMRGGVGRAGGLKFTAATFVPQFAALLREPMFLLGAILYASAAVVWFGVISSEALTISYPLLVSLTFLLVTFGSVFFYQEHVTMFKAFGIGLILAGITIVASR